MSTKRPEPAPAPRSSKSSEPPGPSNARSGTQGLVQQLRVPFDYPVRFTEHAFAPANPALVEIIARREPDRRHRMHVVIDAGVAGAWPDLAQRIGAYTHAHHHALELVAEPETVPGGEACKNDPSQVHTLQRRFFELGLDRHATVVAVGGGAVLDLVGYVAATVHRGIRLVRLPTTVLAQNDSGVGVKNGVNAFGIKNFLGTFAPPFGVLNDRAFLATLEPRDRASGMAEAVKVALVRDASFFEWLHTHAARLRAFEQNAVEAMVRRAAELHLEHIATGGDPFEMGTARPLDFGHWAAHKLESLSEHRLRHGEAVSIGMALDARYSVEAGWLDPPSLERIVALLDTLGLPPWDEALQLRDPEGMPVVLQGLQEFREHLGGELTITLLQAIGHGVETQTVDVARVLRALEWLRNRARPGT